MFIGDFPAIRIIIGWNQKTLSPIMILDTGFNGDLQITPEICIHLVYANNAAGKLLTGVEDGVELF